MTAEIAGVSPELLEYLRSIPERCSFCGFHIQIQGHRGGCQLTGERLRDEGMDATTQAHPDQSAAIDAAIQRLCREKNEWSANDLRPLIPVAARGPLVGARVNAAARRKWMRRVGYVPSTDPGTHGHPVALWSSNDF